MVSVCVCVCEWKNVVQDRDHGRAAGNTVMSTFHKIRVSFRLTWQLLAYQEGRCPMSLRFSHDLNCRGMIPSVFPESC